MRVHDACWDGCPKHRFDLRAMTTLIENDLPVSTVMQAIDGPLIVTRGRQR